MKGDTEAADGFVLITGAKALYAPAAAGGEALFLLGDPSNPPPTIALDEAWADQGAPSLPGWFVFLDAPVTPSSAAATESTLRSGLAIRATSGFVWASGDGSVIRAVATDLDESGAPAVAADVTLPTPAGMLALSFPRNAPLRSRAEGGVITAIGCGAPPGSAPTPASGAGASIQVFGDAAGCVTFEALVGDPPSPNGTVALMAASFDPLQPFDSRRSYRRFTGTGFGFVLGSAGWQLVQQGNSAR